jgi:hypothetical protein
MCDINIVITLVSYSSFPFPHLWTDTRLFVRYAPASYSVVTGLPLRKDAGSKRVSIGKLPSLPKTGTVRSDLLTVQPAQAKAGSV